MKLTGTSDLARMQALQGRAVATRNALDRAAAEMTTGEKASRFKATGGNLTRLFALERSLDRNAVFTETLSLAELRLDTMQDSLGQILAPLEKLGVALAGAVGLGDEAGALLHATTARQDFAATVGRLNGSVAGQSLFAGTATDGPALAAADAMLADLDALVAGAASAADAGAAIDAWFSPPAGGFYASGYVGSATDLAPVEIGENQRLDAGVRADAPELVAVLKAQAKAAVVAGGAFAGDPNARMALLAEAADELIAAKEDLIDLRSAVGRSQEQVETAQAARTAQRDTISIARAALVAVDPLEAASAYQQLEVQLEAIYTVTARLASLRFANFMG